MIHLQRTIDVRSFCLEATVATAADRPEYLAVLQLAVDLERPLDARTVQRELFGDLPDTVGRLVLDRCVQIGLFERAARDQPARLSDAGREALERGDILIQEEGLWRIHYLDDPLLGRRLIHALPLREQTTAQDVRNEIKKKQRQVRGTGADTPALLRQAKGSTWVSLADSRAFAVHELGERGEKGPDSELRLHLRWAEDGTVELSLRGALQLAEKVAAPVDQRLEAPEQLHAFTYDALWLLLVSFAARVPHEELSIWHKHTGKRFLPQAFVGLSEATRRTMRATVEVPTFQHGALGTFEATRVSDVAVVPRGEADALQWAEWLEWDAITSYAIPGVLTASSAAIAARFPYHRPKLRTPDALLKHAARNPTDPRSRFLLAPADLGLW